MPRLLRILAVLFLVALLPMRAVAAVTVGFCAVGQEDMAVAAHADYGKSAQVRLDHHGQPAKPACNICVEHCSSAAFAPSAEQKFSAPAVARVRTVPTERAAPAFVSDQLDRPPLA